MVEVYWKSDGSARLSISSPRERRLKLASINEMLTFNFQLFDLDGFPADAATITSVVVDPEGVETPVTFTWHSTGFYTGTFVCKKKGEHWIRVETTGVKTAREKKFDVAEPHVQIG